MSNRANDRGFTLVELMIVVAIIAVLAAVAVGAYSKWIANAKASEAKSVLADIKIKQDAYRAQFHQYCGTNGTGVWAPNDSTPGKYPILWTGNSTTAADTMWGLMGLTPGGTEMYYRYYIEAGPPTSSAGSSPTARVSGINFGGANDFWFVAQAVGDLDADGECDGFETYSASDRIHSVPPSTGYCP